MSHIEIIMETETAFGHLHSLLSGIDEEHFNTKPSPGSWSPAQVGDHLYRSYAVLETLRGKTAPLNDRNIDEKAREFRPVFLDFDTKLESPDFILPSEKPIEQEHLLSNLQTRTDAIMEFVRENDLSAICLDFELPGAGTLTRLEWLHFISVHTQRHNHQLKNIIKHFPH
jgi:hypothetical protein